MKTNYQPLIHSDALSGYREKGFINLRQVVPDSVLDLARDAISPWVEHCIGKWREAGHFDSDLSEFDFWHRFQVAWRLAGKPRFRRSPFHFLFNENMFELMRAPCILDIAEQLLGTSEISVHGVFNARPLLSEAPDYRVRWHQDSQYWKKDFGDIAARDDWRTHVITMWLPLQSADANSGCLSLISLKDTQGKFYPVNEEQYGETGYLYSDLSELEQLPYSDQDMQCGDLLCFSQLTVHRTAPHNMDHIRWSFDIRYEATETATGAGSKFGFVARSRKAPSSETSFATWMTKQASLESPNIRAAATDLPTPTE